MLKIISLVILISMLVPAVLFSSSDEKPRFKKKAHAKLAGNIGWNALAIDAYYEICFQKGMRLDNHLRGIDKMFKKKWGMSFSKMMLKTEERSGRDFREEAHDMIYKAIKKFNGCNNSGMKKWFDTVSKTHGKNLDKFHVLK